MEEEFTIHIVIMLLVGLAAGCLGAMAGLGGGVVMIPALQLVAKFDLPQVIGTTLFAVIFTSLSAAQGHYRAGNVRLRSAGYAALGGLIGVLLGSYVFVKYLSGSFALLEIALGLFFGFTTYRMGKDAYGEFFGKKEVAEANAKNRENVPALLGLGLFTGSLTGMLGIGGGMIFTPGFMFLGQMSPQVAVGTTMVAMLPLALSGGLIKLYQGYVNLPAGIMLGLGTIVGAQIGVWISNRISPALFKVLFTLLFAFLALDYLLPHLP
ncbi:MAG TPA: sulfite exporter TauE/SafE family protein [Syntrophomonas sp.]|jgi:uncharacterized membrane protein YfcA|nr:sulfite exporter TauE/SafE family protein [Syntrophomonas sp.]